MNRLAEKVLPLGGGSGGPQSLAARLSQLLVIVATFGLPGLILPRSGVDTVELRSLPVLLASTTAVLAAIRILHQRSRPHHALPTRTDDVSLVTTSICAGALSMVVVLAVLDAPIPLVELALRSAAGTLILLVLRGLIRQETAGHTARRVIVIGVGEEAREAVELLGDHPEADLELVGVVGRKNVAERSGLAERWLGDVDELVETLDRAKADLALVTITGFRAHDFRSILETLRLHHVELALTTGIAHLGQHTLRLGSVVHEPMVNIDWPRPGPVFAATKRAVDIVGALVGLVLALPVFVCVALAIKFDDRGPVFYRSARVGRDGVEFDMLKFRSMSDGAHDLRSDLAQRNERSGPLFKISADPRITRVGQVLRNTSIDEIPQFWNVLRGEMSLVGPRPALVEEAAAFDSQHRARFVIPPGITGLWQVEARANPNFSAYRRLDLQYLRNHSIRRDLEILGATFVQVAVALVSLPLSLVDKRSSSDAIDLREAAGVIDLRERRPRDVQMPSAEAGNAGGGGLEVADPNRYRGSA